MLYDIYQPDGHRVATCEINAASDLMQISGHEIVWSIEEFGRCDTDEYTALPYMAKWAPLDIEALQ